MLEVQYFCSNTEVGDMFTKGLTMFATAFTKDSIYKTFVSHGRCWVFSWGFVLFKYCLSFEHQTPLKNRECILM